MVPEEARRFIGKATPPQVREVEKGAIRRYADAMGNYNPLYCEEEYALKSAYGAIIAPPAFFGWAMKRVKSSTGLPDIVGDLQEALAKGGFGRILDGGVSYEFHLPVRAGDILIASTAVKDIAEKEGKSGAMMICRLETSYLNQNGDLVATAQQTFIAR